MLYYILLAIGLFYFIQYLDTHSVGQILWDGICLLVQFVFGIILLVIGLYWIAHSG